MPVGLLGAVLLLTISCVLVPGHRGNHFLAPDLTDISLLPGTDATHAEHIETIKTRMYVGLTADQRFLPGQLGMGLVEGEGRALTKMAGSLPAPSFHLPFHIFLRL